MKRRDFLKKSVATSVVAGLTYRAAELSGAESNSGEGREFYEWRAYHFKAGDDHALLDSYLEKALIPALNRLGSKPVGVFTEIEPKEDPAVFVLIPHASLEAFVASGGKLMADAAHNEAGADYLQTAKNKPGFVRIDIWLLRAFTGMPRLELPAYCKEKKPRIFEARTYESHSEVKALKKIDMFNAGEIEVMRDVGLGPIFYGQALTGRDLPHLTYMLSGENRDAHRQHFGAFGRDARWKKISGDPQYADTVSKITSRFLQPASFSQI